MSSTADEICQELELVRRNLTVKAATVRHSVNRLLDWKLFVARHPVLVFGSAAAAGIVLAPRGKTQQRVVLSSEGQGEFGQGEFRASHEQPAELRPIPSLWSRLAPALSLVGPPLLRLAVGAVASRLVPPQLDNQHPQSAEQKGAVHDA